MNLFLESTMAGWEMDASMMGYWMLLLVFIRLIPSPKWVKRAEALLWFLVLETAFLTALSDASFYVLWGSRFNAQALVFLRYPAECWASLSRVQILGGLLLTALALAGSRWVKLGFPGPMQYPKFWLFMPMFLGFVAARGGLGTTPLQASACLYSEDALSNAAASNATWNLCFVLTQQQYKPDLSLWVGASSEHGYCLDSAADSSDLRLTHIDKPHVFVFVLESFSAELSSVFSSGKGLINGQSEMPFLDSMAMNSLRFSKAYAAGDRTDKGLAAILAAYPGQVWQSLLNEPDRFSKHLGLASAFKQKEYTASFWYGGDGEFSNTSAFARAMGFDRCLDESKLDPAYERDKWGISDASVLQEIEQYMDNHSQMPQLITWLSLSSHEPYRLAELDPEFEFGWSEMQRYRSTIRYTDAALGAFWQRNAHKSWFQHSLFVIVADHGRDIETGYTPLGNPAFFHIPFWIGGPALKEELRGTDRKVVISQTDLGNTLLNGLWGQSLMGKYSRNALSNGHPSCAVWHCEHRLGWIDSSGAIQGQIELAPGAKMKRLRALENELWQGIDEGNL